MLIDALEKTGQQLYRNHCERNGYKPTAVAGDTAKHAILSTNKPGIAHVR